VATKHTILLIVLKIVYLLISSAAFYYGTVHIGLDSGIDSPAAAMVGVFLFINIYLGLVFLESIYDMRKWHNIKWSHSVLWALVTSTISSVNMLFAVLIPFGLLKVSGNNELIWLFWLAPVLMVIFEAAVVFKARPFFLKKFKV
jgi:hypothetical protein